MKRLRLRLTFALTTVLLLSFGATGAFADALHGFCWGDTPVCSDNGTVTPMTSTSPNFGFWTDGTGSLTGDYWIAVLAPNVPGNSGLSFSITGGTTDPATANLFSPTAWTIGDLYTYLGIDRQPNNPIGAFLPSTNLYAPSATGYDVFVADLGVNTLGTSAGSAPLLSLTGSDLPLG